MRTKNLKKELRTHAFFRVSDEEISNDLVQETFTKTWNYLIREGKIELMKPFLYHVLNCLIIDEYRKHKHASLDVLLDAGFEPSSYDFARIFDIYDGKLAVELIEELPLTYRKVMFMRYVQELSLPEIANITGYSKNTVAVRTHRGLEKLKVLYQLHNPNS